MDDVRLPPAALREFTAGALEAVGVPIGTAESAAAQLVRADLAGHRSHGVRLLADYCARVRSGRIDPLASPAVERDQGSTVALDGRYALGHVAGHAAAAIAVERARRHGVAAVTMRRSGHLGRLADYVERMADEGMIGVIAANDAGANEVVAPFGSLEPRLATNPLAVAIPRAEPPHLVLDMATSAASHGSVDLHRQRGETVPPEWAEGETLLPLGGAKGTGLALVVEVLAGILSRAGFSDGQTHDDDQGVWILALDPERFLERTELAQDVERLVAHVHTAEPEPGAEVLVPGEPSSRTTTEQEEHGVLVAGPVWHELLHLARELDVPMPAARLTVEEVR